MDNGQIEEEYTSKEWKELVKNLKGKHAERMNELLETLPDKQFRIIYPKMLEFMMPKLQRQEIIKSLDNENSVLRIEVVTHPAELEQPIIDVTPENDGD